MNVYRLTRNLIDVGVLSGVVVVATSEEHARAMAANFDKENRDMFGNWQDWFSTEKTKCDLVSMKSAQVVLFDVPGE